MRPASSRGRVVPVAAAGIAAAAAAALALWVFGGRSPGAAEPPGPPDPQRSVPAEEPPPLPDPRPSSGPVLSLAPEPRAEADAGQGDEAEPAGTEPSKARATGLLDVHCRPWASAALDGRPIGTTPVTGIRLPAGSHSLVLSNPEQGFRKTLKIEVRPGRTTVVREEIPAD